MEYAQLGKSSLNISRIGFGCMLLKEEAASEILINDAIEKGINFFDTADLYNKGDNEILVGKAIGKKRKDVIIATKGGNQWNEDGTTWRWNASPRYLETTIEKSLQRLG